MNEVTYEEPVKNDAGEVIAGNPEDVLHPYIATTNGAGGLKSFHLWAYDDQDTSATAAAMVARYRNDGRGPYKDLELVKVKRQ